MATIICWRSGETEVASYALAGTITLMIGPRRRLQALLETQARLAHDGETLLVPGLPEATDDVSALDATIAFQTRLQSSLRRRAAR